MKTELYPNLPGPVSIRFTHNQSPVDTRLGLLGELLAANGKRIWAGYGRDVFEVFEHAAAWWDNSNGRAGHTPPIRVEGFEEQEPFAAAQARIECLQSARMGARA